MAATQVINSGQMIDIGGYRLCFQSAGAGKPTVIIEAGLGEGMAEWQALQAQVADFTRVCAYDRAGVGRSEKGPKPRTSRQMVNELRTLLSNAQIEAPYILAAHSLGALNAQLFAAEFPNEIAGLVLIDPSFAEMTSALERAWGKLRLSIFLSMAYASGTEGSSLADFRTSCAQVTAAGKLPDVPLVVISAGQPAKIPGIMNALFPGEAWLRAFQEGHAALAQSSSQGRHLIAEKSTHTTIYHDELVVEAIRQVVAAARQA